MTKAENVGTKYTRHTRDDVVVAALRILDEYGLPDLTMRRLGATLDVQPSALYWHFANKQTLLASLADRIVERAKPVHPTDDDWKVATRSEAYALRDALLAFRDGAEVVSSTLALGLGAGLPLNLLSNSLERGGFDHRTSEIAAAALLHFILGHVSHEQQRIQADSLGVVAEAVSTNSPHCDVTPQGLEAFEFGITLLLTGLELHSHTSTTAV